MIWILLLLTLPFQVEASLLARQLKPAAFFGKRSVSKIVKPTVGEAKQDLIRHAYGLPMNPDKMDELVKEFGPVIASERNEPYCTDPIFMIAVMYQNKMLVRSWIQNGLEPNCVSWDNRNAWHCYQHVNPVIRDMLKKAAVSRTTCETLKGLNPIQFHAAGRRQQVVDDLIQSEIYSKEDLITKPSKIKKIISAFESIRYKII